jgi:hypothetical protein
MVSILCCKGIVIIILGFVGILLLLVVLDLEAISCNVLEILFVSNPQC